MSRRSPIHPRGLGGRVWLPALLLVACGQSPTGTEDEVAPVLDTFSANPVAVEAGKSTEIAWSWSFANAPSPDPSCHIEPGVGAVANGDRTSVTLEADTLFTLTCANAAGEDDGEVTITASAPAVAPILADVEATPPEVLAGEPTPMTWTWAFANSPTPEPDCTIEPEVGPVASGDVTTVTLDADTLFTVTCTNGGGGDDASLTLSAVPAAAPLIDTFVADPTVVIEGTATDVTWRWTFSNLPAPAPSCGIEPDVGPLSEGATTSVTLDVDTLFTLTCANTLGSDVAQLFIGTTPPPVAPELASFTTTPDTVVQGEATGVSWQWTYANSPIPPPTCNVDGGVGTVGNGDIVGVTLAADALFTLTCANGAGSDQAQTTIATTPPPVPPELDTFTATPDTVVAGEATDVTWRWTYANSPDPTPTCSIDPDLGSVTNADTRSVTLDADTVFTLTCANAAGSDQMALTLGATPAPVAPVIDSFSAAPSTVVQNQATDVTWSWSFANAPSPDPICSISPDVGPLASGQTTSVTLSAETVFTLTCTNSAGSDDAALTLPVQSAPVLAGFFAAPWAVVANAPTEIIWTWHFANAPLPAPVCSISPGIGTVTPGVTSTVTQAANETYLLTCTNAHGSDNASLTVLAQADRGGFTAASGHRHACAVRSDQTVTCWGYDYAGETNAPADAFLSVSAGQWLTCGVKIDQTVACWGWSSIACGTNPTVPSGTFLAVSAGRCFACGLRTDGTTTCWGSGSSGQTSPPPDPMVEIAVGGYHGCGLDSDGMARCWGNNTYGQSNPL